MREGRVSHRILFSYFKFLKKSKKQIFVAIVAGALYGLSSGFGIPIILEYSSSYLFDQKEIHPLVLAGLVSLPILIMFIRGTMGFLSSYYFAACGQRIVDGLRVMIFEKIQRLHIGFFNDYHPSELISRSINAVTIIQTNLVDVANSVIAQPLVLLGATGYLAYLCMQQSDLIILLLFLLALPAFIFPIRRIGRRLRNQSGQMQSRTAAIINKLNHNLSAIKEVRAFGLESQETERYKIACNNFSEAFLQVAKYQLIISPLVEILSAAGVGFAMFYAYKNGLKLEIFMSLATALYFGYDAIKKLGEISSKIQTSMAAVDRIESILSESEKVLDPQNPVDLSNCQGHVSFQDVTFSYDQEKIALLQIDADMVPGKIYALVGSSGSGKSTFVNMILRFYDPEKGSIAIDGIDVRELLQSNLRKNIGYVPQDPALINDTVFNNIIWGNPKATHEEVIQAAQRAYAHDFISQMPEGYDTLIGESGSCLSGGQRQRIALARVFLRNSPILIFDEATSALDSESQQAIYKAIENIARNRTVLMISHRFSMMSIVDEVFVFFEGKIIEKGCPGDLLKQDSFYRNLYEKQQMKSEIN